MEQDGKGLRYNEGKTRFALVSPFSEKGNAEIVTIGANKYAERNWERGMKWTTVADSLYRHMNAFMRGEDYDPETGKLHIDHVQTNASFLSHYYRFYPQGDDRPKNPLLLKRIGLDIDDVCADFVGGIIDKFGFKKPSSWYFTYDNFMEGITDDKDFWLSLKPKCDPSTIPFEPACYVTSRPIPSEWTMEWLEKNGFPCAKVITIGQGEKKSDVLKDKVDVFIDDRFEYYRELNEAGIFCYLMDAGHNQRYDVGHKRIFELSDLATGRHLSKK